MGLDPKKIIARREKLGITLQEAGERAGFAKSPRQAWHRIEQGNAGTTIDAIEQICTALQCSVLDLLADDSPAHGPVVRSRRKTHK